MVSSLGYSLVRAGHRVLMIDGDPATHGLSLFLLGPKVYQQINSFEEQNTFTGVLRAYNPGEPLHLEPRSIHRTATDDHGVSYEALISTTNVYGDVPEHHDDLVVPDLDRRTFDAGVAALFDELRSLRAYDYVLVDTRGGFAFETTDICALADSFILVTEPDFTSFYQDRNLVKRISAAAQEVKRKPLLRSIIVNKATEGGQTEGALDLTKLEASFRLELTREFPIEYANTHLVPLDLEAVKAYKTQRMPYLAAPGSQYSFSTLAAFSDILQVVTSRWTEERVRRWNTLIDEVSHAVRERNEDMQRAKNEAQQHAAAHAQAQAKVAEQAQQIATLQQRVDEQRQAYERESQRTELLLNDRMQTSMTQERERRRVRRQTASILVFMLVVVLIIVAVVYWRVARPSVETIVERAYSLNLPPQLRINYVIQLRTGGWRNFDKIDLSNLTFPAGDWTGTSFRDANLSRASLRNAKLRSEEHTSE